MQSYYYYKIIRKTIIQFCDLFNSIKIARYASNGIYDKTITVPLKLGPKQKIWHWLRQRKDDKMLPILSVMMESLEFASERVGNKIHHVSKTKDYDLGILEKFINPIPYNFTFNLNIWSEYIADVDQILEQILPYFSPDIFIRINVPELDATLNLKVIFQSCSPDVTSEIQDEDQRIIKWVVSFLVQGYLFQPLKIDGNDVVYEIDSIGDLTINRLGIVCSNGTHYAASEEDCENENYLGVVCSNGTHTATTEENCTLENYTGMIKSASSSEKMIKKQIIKYYAHDTTTRFTSAVGTESAYTSGSGQETVSTYLKVISPYRDSDGDAIYTYEEFD